LKKMIELQLYEYKNEQKGILLVSRINREKNGGSL